MKKIYCVEEWWLENEPVRDLVLLMNLIMKINSKNIY